MMNWNQTFLAAALMVGGWAVTAAAQEEGQADEKKAPITFEFGDGVMELTSPGDWEKVAPKSNLLDAEFKIPRAESDSADGRLTIMGAGGGVQANIDRWLDQFEGSSKMDEEKMEVAGQKVVLVSITGDYLEGMGGPFGPKTKREDYRMLAAIIQTEKYGLYFIKLTGPRKTIDGQEEKFKAFVETLKMKE